VIAIFGFSNVKTIRITLNFNREGGKKMFEQFLPTVDVLIVNRVERRDIELF